MKLVDVKNKKPASRPLAIVWNITGACNSRCIHCYMNAGKPLPNELTTEEGRGVLEQVADIKPFYLGFLGGEPLVRKDIWVLLKYATDLGIPVTVGSNGMMISDRIARKLKDLNIVGVQVSIDSYKAEIHDRFRGVPGLFEKAINAIKALRKVGLATGIGFTPTQVNWQDFPKVVDLALELSVGAMDTSQFVPTGRGEQWLDLNQEQYKELYAMWLRRKMEVKDQITMETHKALLALIDSEHAKKEHVMGCAGAWTLMCIHPDGKVSSCPLMPVEAGNARKQSLMEIWKNSPFFTQLRDRDKFKGKCGICDLRYSCGGCRSETYAYTGDYLETDPRCWYTPKSPD